MCGIVRLSFGNIMLHRRKIDEIWVWSNGGMTLRVFKGKILPVLLSPPQTAH